MLLFLRTIAAMKSLPNYWKRFTALVNPFKTSRLEKQDVYVHWSAYLPQESIEPMDRYNATPYRDNLSRILVHDSKTNLKWVETFDSAEDAGNYCLALYSGDLSEGELHPTKVPDFLFRPRNSKQRIFKSDRNPG